MWQCSVHLSLVLSAEPPLHNSKNAKRKINKYIFCVELKPDGVLNTEEWSWSVPHREANKLFVTHWYKIQGLESYHKRQIHKQPIFVSHNADRVLNEWVQWVRAQGDPGWLHFTGNLYLGSLIRIQVENTLCERVREREWVCVATQRYFQLNHIFMLGDICVLDQSPVTCSCLVINRRAGSTDAFANSADCVVQR